MKYINSISKQQTLKLFGEHISQPKVDYFLNAGIDFVMGKRDGAFIWDSDDQKKLINCHNNGGVFNLGHRNPVIIEALKSSLDELDIGNHHLISEQRALLAKKIASLTPGDLNHTVFGVSGGEAIDLAIKIARAYSGKTKVISALGGYHGHTGLALATGDEKYRRPFGPMPIGFVQVPFNDIAALKQELDSDTAVIILETIPATLGMPIPSPNYFKEVRQLCDENNIVLIIDEVQTGLGRTGKLWGIEHFDIVPDIMVLGKGLSGGIYPMTATIFRDKYQSVFVDDPFIHISTFGGAEIGVPVASKVLDISSGDDFLQHVNELAELFTSEFAQLQVEHSEILVGLRQLGLMMGIEFVSRDIGPLFTKICYENGLLAIFAANDPKVVQLLPALNISKELALEIIAKINISLEQTKQYLAL